MPSAAGVSSYDMSESYPLDLYEVRKRIDGINSRVTLMTQIDASIEDLVGGLIRWGVHTLMSCEGHRHGNFRLPFVDVLKNEAYLALHLAGDWALDSESRFIWALTLPRKFVSATKDDGGPLTFFRLQPMRRKDMGAVGLKSCKADARAFGQFLLHRRCP